MTYFKTQTRFFSSKTLAVLGSALFVFNSLSAYAFLEDLPPELRESIESYLTISERQIGLAQVNQAFHQHYSVSQKAELKAAPNTTSSQANAVYSLKSSEKNYLVSGTESGLLQMWDLESSELAFSLNSGNQSPITALYPSPANPSEVLSVSADHRVRLWDLEKKELISEFPEEPSEIVSVLWVPSGFGFRTLNRMGQLTVWEKTKPNTPYLAPAEVTAGSQLIGKYFLLNEPETFFIASNNQEVRSQTYRVKKTIVRTFNVNDADHVKPYVAPKEPESEPFVPAYLDAPKSYRKPKSTSTSSVVAMAFSSSGQLGAVWTNDNRIRFWSISGQKHKATYKHEGTLKVYTGARVEASRLAISPYEDLLVTSTGTNVIRIWDLNQFKSTAKAFFMKITVAENSVRVQEIQFSPNGKSLAVSLSDGRINVYQIP